MIFTKADASSSDEQVEKLIREFKIHYIAWIGSFIYLLSTRLDLSFTLHKIEHLSEKPDKLNFEGLVHILIYIRDNKLLGLKYYAKLNDAQVSDLLRQSSIKTENQLMAFSDSSWQDCLDTVRSTGAYIIFYQVGPIEHGTHVTEPVSQ